jgi:hypothetical protein
LNNYWEAFNPIAARSDVIAMEPVKAG